MRIVAPFGFYGWGNIGDEATLQGFARLVERFDEPLRVSVASRNLGHTARVEPAFRYFRAEGRDPRRWWARRLAAAYAVAGGTPIMDVLGEWPLCEVAPLVAAAGRAGKPMVFVGVGVERLRRSESRRVFEDHIAKGVAHWTVRSERDRERLLEYGTAAERVTVAADVAWLLDGVPSEWGWRLLESLGVRRDAPVVSVNLTNERFVEDGAPRLAWQVAGALDRLVEECRAQVVFLCNEIRPGGTFDRAAGERVRALMRHRGGTWLVPNEYWTPGQMMSLVGCSTLAVSMRYHFCLFAALQGVPFVALERSDKVSDLCWDLAWPYGVPIEEVAGPALAELAVGILAGHGRPTPCLSERVGKMKRRAELNRLSLRVATGSSASDPVVMMGATV